MMSTIAVRYSLRRAVRSSGVSASEIAGEALHVGEEDGELAPFPAEGEPLGVRDELLDDRRAQVLLEGALDVALLLAFRGVAGEAATRPGRTRRPAPVRPSAASTPAAYAATPSAGAMRNEEHVDQRGEPRPRGRGGGHARRRCRAGGAGGSSRPPGTGA